MGVAGGVVIPIRGFMSKSFFHGSEMLVRREGEECFCSFLVLMLGPKSVLNDDGNRGQVRGICI